LHLLAERGGKFGLAPAVMRERQQRHHRLAGSPRIAACQQLLPGKTVGGTWEQRVTIDQSLPRRRPGLSSAIGLPRRLWMMCR
jgi:hypothetical protein